jgi:hypothetical protein
MLRNVIVFYEERIQLVTPLTYIWEVLASNLNRETDNPCRVFFVSPVPQSEQTTLFK